MNALFNLIWRNIFSNLPILSQCLIGLVLLGYAFANDALSITDKETTLVVDKSDLAIAALKTNADSVSVWGMSYFIPESASVISEISSGLDTAHVKRYKVPLVTFKEQVVDHLAQQCYSGKPLLDGLKEAGVNHVISCPIIGDMGEGNKMMVGFVAAYYKELPTNINEHKSVLTHTSTQIKVGK